MHDPSSNAPVEGQSLVFPGDEASSLVGSLVADRYQVEARLGEGAMGAVYRAKHIHMQKDVALKVLHQSMSSNPEVVRRFEREAVAAGRVEHPNVAGASDFGRLADGSFYLVLEFINGLSLGELIEQTGAMPPERAARIALQIAAALAAAHREGIVHRDLKPDNVMLPSGEHEGDIVKVLDFGMAKMAQADDAKATKLTMHGAVYGTPAYMAPEQAAGNDVDHRADLYALGLMLYEMVSGRAPFEADQVMALLVKQMTEKVPPLPSTVPRKLAQLIMKLLEKKPEDRQQSADEVVSELVEFLGVAYADPRLSAMGLMAPTSRPSMSSSAETVKARVSETVARVAPLLGKAVVASGPAVNFLKEPMTVKGVTFPRWMPAAAAFGFVVVLIVLSVGGGEAARETGASGGSEGPAGVPRDADPAGKDRNPPDPELAKVITAAGLGSDSALYALDQRKDADRSLTEWMGLAKARLMRKNVKKALVAYREAINLDPSMKTDKTMLGALRKLADDEDQERAELVLDFAADELGPLGADMLFHVWSKTSLKTPAATRAYSLLTTSKVKKNFSPGLEIAMKLREAKTCDDALELMPRVAEVGDTRVMNPLQKMLKNRGCGDSGRDDCYPCMRDGKAETALKDATTAAAMRSTHNFELSDFRWKK